MTSISGSAVRVTRARVLLAFAAVYFIWGSTYLAIRVAIETLPPLLMAGVRFMTAGAILYLWMRLRGEPAPRRVHWKSAFIVGGFLLLGGNGGVVWAEQSVPSGLAALLIATVPLWMALLAWWRGDTPRPSGRIAAGLLLGLAGVALLVAARGMGDSRGVNPMGAIVLVLASLSWAHGSLVSRRAPLPSSPFLATAMEMLAGGFLLVLGGLLRGEWGHLDLAAVSTRSIVALLYLLIFGSFLGFTAYIYLLGATTPARASTYAFVNPLVAVILGWAILGESLSPRTLLASGIIIAGVVLIIHARAKAGRAGSGEEHVEDEVVTAREVAATTPTPLRCSTASGRGGGVDRTANARL